MEEKLLEIIGKHFPDSNADSEKWQYVLENSTSVPSINYLLSMVDYYVSYRKNNGAINCSL